MTASKGGFNGPGGDQQTVRLASMFLTVGGKPRTHARTGTTCKPCTGISTPSLDARRSADQDASLLLRDRKSGL